MTTLFARMDAPRHSPQRSHVVLWPASLDAGQTTSSTILQLECFGATRLLLFGRARRFREHRAQRTVATDYLVCACLLGFNRVLVTVQEPNLHHVRRFGVARLALKPCRDRDWESGLKEDSSVLVHSACCVFAAVLVLARTMPQRNILCHNAATTPICNEFRHAGGENRTQNRVNSLSLKPFDVSGSFVNVSDTVLHSEHSCTPGIRRSARMA